MSSIYQKGRDGYYYYQTYIYNPQTGKKDKRIFHSLGTKEKTEAKRKQDEYDAKYKSKHQGEVRNNKLFLSNQSVKYLLLIMATTSITLYIANRTDSKPSLPLKSVSSKKSTLQDSKISSTSRINPFDQKTKKEPFITNKNAIQLDSIKLKRNEIKPPSVKIPDFNVELIDRLSGSFEQAKIYLTVENGPSKQSLKALCNKVKDEHSEFSNLIICVYSNTPSGLEIIRNQARGINSYEQKNSWLAMYTYNPVEGEYFDNNPSGYLGGSR